MSLMPFAILIGLAVGFLTGGRLRHLGDRHLSLVPLLFVGAALQVVAQGGWAADYAHLLIAHSFFLIAVFALANLRHAGMGVVAVGLLMNVATIAVNVGMPVEERAIVAAGIVDDPSEIATLDFKAKRHLMTSDDTLYWLSDIIPVKAFGGQVLSFGDLVLCAGIVSLMANLLHPFPRRRRGQASTSARHLRTGSAPPAPEGEVSLSPPATRDDGDELIDLRALEPSPLRSR